jgi:hypothetical protein
MPGETADGDAPVGRPVLELLRDRLRTTDQVTTARITDDQGHLGLVVIFSDDYYPGAETAATLIIRWYTNADFSIHYRESRRDSDWECRWDRHPNPHNEREHFHPPPDVATPGKNRSWPDDYREMLRVVLQKIEDRIDHLWS